MGEKKSSRNQTSRKERKAKKRAAEDLIPDIPVSEPEFSSAVNEEKFLDKTANTADHDGNKKRKRNRADEEGVAEEDDHDGKNEDKEESEEKKKRKRSKKQSNKESNFDDKVDNNCESGKRDVEKRDEEEASAKDEEEANSKMKKKKKNKIEKGKEHKAKKNPNLRDIIIDDEENCFALGQESTSQKSKKERKAEGKSDAIKPGNNDRHDKEESDAKVDKNNKVGTNNTNEKETCKKDDTTTNIEEKKKTSKTKKDKKKKKKELQEQPGESTPTSTSEDTSLLSKTTTTTTTTTTAPTATAVAVEGSKNTSETLSVEKVSSNVTTKSAARFIVFVGNLPYTATTASIMSHFSKLKPVSVRHLTKKEDPSKSRGIAFVEFENYDTHKTALKIMHHSIFDDGKSEPRMINVELTAGGGGNTEDRKAKIKSKNERLNDQRIRRKEEEEKAKTKKEEEKAKLNKVPLSEADQSSSESNIHPSRRRMITA